MQRRNGCLVAIIKSFYSRDLYRDVVQNWGFGVVLYLLLLLTLCWGILAIPMQKNVELGYTSFSDKLFPQIPVMEIKNGELKTPENRPYVITDPHNKQVLAIIDTSGKYQNLDKTTASLLLTKHAVYYQNDAKMEKMRNFSADLNLDIKPQNVKSISDRFVHWAWLLFLPALILLTFIYRIIEAALYAILGEIFSMIAKISLTYGEVFRLSIFAMTPAIIISTILDWFLIGFRHQLLFYFLLSMAYLVFGVLANKQEGK